MAYRFFIGEKVRTKQGIGIVVAVSTWRDSIKDMEELEAMEFCALCKSQVGIGFKDDWVEVIVEIAKRTHIYQARDLELLEGRDYGDYDEARRRFNYIKKVDDTSTDGEQGDSEGSGQKKKRKKKDRFMRMR